MAVLTWDGAGQRFYETGLDRGVLYIPDNAGAYATGVAWNGLTAVTESPSGAEANAVWADNIKYLNLYSVEEFSATIEAFTFPDEFAQFDGVVAPYAGVSLGQQPRKTFGISYRTKVGNDLNDELGYKYHLVYGLKASPSERAYATQSDSPEAIPFSWEVMSLPVAVAGNKPLSIITVDTTKVVDPASLTALTNALYGTGGTTPRLPLPDEVIAMFAASPTAVTSVSPTFVASTGVITIPAVTGVTYRRADTGAVVAAGTVTIGTAGASLTITAAPTSAAYVFSSASDGDWVFTRNP